MDKTLADYIKRVQEQNDKPSDKVWHNRNVWNDPALANLDRENPNDYKVYPEEDGYDRPRNPYSNH